MPTMRMLDQPDELDRTGGPAANARVAQASKDFMNDYPDYYGSEHNTQKLIGWLTERGFPITRLNLSEAFEQLTALGALHTRPEIDIHVPKDSKMQGDRGVQKIGSMDTVKINFPVGSDAERNLTGQQPHRMQEIMGDSIAAATAHLVELRDSSEIGKPVSKELRYEYGASLRQERAKKATVARTAEARAVVALNNPGMRRDTSEFNRLVAETLAQ